MCEKEVCGIYGPSGELYTKVEGWGDKIDLEQFYPWLATNYLIRGRYAIAGTGEIGFDSCNTTEIWQGKVSPWTLYWARNGFCEDSSVLQPSFDLVPDVYDPKLFHAKNPYGGEFEEEDPLFWLQYDNGFVDISILDNEYTTWEM